MSRRQREEGRLAMVGQIDFNELYTLVFDATRKTFQAILDQHPDETFYVFALYYLDDDLAISPSCGSEEGHLRVENLTTTDRDEKTLDWFYARWSFWDWSYCSASDYFVPVNAWIAYYLQPLVGGVTDDGVTAHLIVMGMIEKICLNVMQALDHEGLFGVGQVREHIVLNVMNKDTLFVEDDLSCVYLLNPTSTYERWRIEFEMWQHALRLSDINFGLF